MSENEKQKYKSIFWNYSQYQMCIWNWGNKSPKKEEKQEERKRKEKKKKIKSEWEKKEKEWKINEEKKRTGKNKRKKTPKKQRIIQSIFKKILIYFCESSFMLWLYSSNSYQWDMAIF